MSGSVDDEVVRMRFDNNAFERAVATTISTLSKLKSNLNFSGADKGLDRIEAKANGFSLQGMSNGIEGISKKFLVLSTVAITALANIANRAVNAGLQVAKSFTIQPILDGFHEYETQLNSVQTILANTGLKGKAGMEQVNTALNELNRYSDKTIYNFTEMARNIGTFTAAGVKLKPATQAIKGIANVAALSGSSSEQASTAMYQLSQAIANNKVGLQDWNSVVNAGMGGKVFQSALFNVAKMKGTLKGVKANETFDQWTKAGNSFRNSLQQGWITGDVLTSTLAQFTGDLTDAQLKSQGYNATQIKQIQEQAKVASDAATKVKTFTQLMGTLKEAVGSGWGQTFLTIFGNFDEAKTLWTGVSQSIGSVISNSANARNKILKDWKALGGRTQLINGIQAAFSALGAVVKPIKDAFREVFPRKTGKDLYDLTLRFANFMKSLKIGPETAANLKRTFAGFFALLDIGKQVVGAIFHVLANLFGIVTHGSGGFLSMTANVGDLIVAFDKALREGGLISNFFKIIGNVLAVPIHLLGLLGTIIGDLFSRFRKPDADSMTSSVIGAGDALSRMADITQRVSDYFAGLAGKIRPAVAAVVRVVGRIGDAIAKGLGSDSFGNILSGIQTGLLAAIVVMFKKFLTKGFNVDIGHGFLGKAGEALDGLTGNLKAMQTQLKAKALLEIAGAIGIITASVVALSFIKASKVQDSLRAIAIGFGELLGAMGILTKISGSAGFIKIPVMAASLDLLAGAILILTAAVALMSRLSWDELKRGLTGIGVLLAAITAASIPLSMNSGGMVRAGIGITAIAVAMNLLFIAVKAFSTMKWGEMLKGLAAVGIALVGIAGAMHLMPKGMTLQAASLVLIAGALNLLYLAVKNFSNLAWGDMLKGMAGVASALVAIAGAMHLMPAEGMLAQAVALNLLGLALQLIYKAVSNMAKMSWTEMAKGLTGLAGSLVILAGALKLMQGAIGGAAALLVVSAALRLFVPSLIALSKMKWGSIGKGLAALAASFAVLGAGALVLGPLIPAMLALGAAMALVGVAMLAFGAGTALLGVGLAAVAASGGAAIAVLLNGLKGFLLLLPVAAKSIATAFVNFIVIIGENAPKIIGAFVSILTQLLQAIPKVIPSLIKALDGLVVAFLKVLTDNAPRIIAAGFELLMDLLKGISRNIGRITTTVVDIIVKFLNTLADNMDRIIQAGVNLLTKFLVGIAKALGQMPGIVLQVIWAFLKSLFGGLGKIVAAGARFLGSLVSGILSGIGHMAEAAVSLIGRFLGAIGGLGWRLLKAGADVVGKIVGAITSAIGKAAKALWDAAWDLASRIIDGIIDGIKSLAHKAWEAIKSLAGNLLGGIGGALGIGGPSKEFMKVGEYSGQGLIMGLDNMNQQVTRSASNMGSSAVTALNKTISGLGAAVAKSNIDYNPTVTPVLDLTQFNKDAQRMTGLVDIPAVNARVSFGQASDISIAQQEAQAAEASTPAAAPASTVLKFEQTNVSPKPLSTIDLYRQTRNQLSAAKRALGVVTPELEH